MRDKIKTYVISMGIALAVGGLSGLITADSMEKYGSLRQPSLAPPGWVFPVVWTILFVLMGAGAAIVYLKRRPSGQKALAVYGLQLLVNFFWPILFFLLEARLFAFFWLLILLMLAVWMTVLFRKSDRTAATLQIPYILWLLFAGYLNLASYLLNG